MQQGPDALREIAGSCLALAQTAADEADRALLIIYASVCHDLAVQLERLARVKRDGEDR